MGDGEMGMDGEIGGKVYYAQVYYSALLPVMVQWGKQLRLLDIFLGFGLVAYHSDRVGNDFWCKRDIN